MDRRPPAGHRSTGPRTSLTRLLVAYAAASLVHFVHNAEYLSEYPNLPASLTRTGVYAAWLAQACIGLSGYVLLRRGWTQSGLILIGAYALIGYGGLAHYLAAPFSAHTWDMNATIWLEVAAATALLVAVVRRL